MANPNWKKGMLSPNPGGRPTLPTGVRLALEEVALTAARNIADKVKEGDLDASERVLDRLYGKPRQSSDISITENPRTDLMQNKLEEFTEDELAETPVRPTEP